MRAIRVIALGACVLVGLSACANTGVVPMDAGTYLVAVRDAPLGFGPPVTAEADAYKQANAYCAAKGLKVKTIKLEKTDSGFARPAAVSLQFMCAR